MHLFQNEGSGGQYRHEFKYEIDSRQFEAFRFRLSEIIRPDPHAGENGRYNIRSLYFDDYYNRYFYDNEVGVDPREKFRIRIYNHSDQRISLELKCKQADKTLKKACPISRQQVERLLAGENILWSDELPPLQKKLYLLGETKLLRPKIIVEYDRIPYICQDGNVRITLDHNIGASASVDRFFEPEAFLRPIMPLGVSLLEVKYDQFLPDYIYRTIQSEGLRRTTYSKFYYCRKFGGML